MFYVKKGSTIMRVADKTPYLNSGWILSNESEYNTLYNSQPVVSSEVSSGSSGGASFGTSTAANTFGASGNSGNTSNDNQWTNIRNQIISSMGSQGQIKVNGKSAADWLNALPLATIEKLWYKGYGTNEIANEALSQVNYNRSAYTKDMTQYNNNQNTPYNFGSTASGTDGQNVPINETSNNATEQPTTTLDTAGLQRLNSFIDGMDLTQTEKDFLKATFVNSDNYTSGRIVPSNDQISQWITDSATQATADTNPYYNKITAQEREDYKNQMADIRAASASYATNEASTYKQKLAETKANLRARGLTFSGLERGTLGKEGAIGAAGVEGTLPSNRRATYEEQVATWQRQGRDIGIAAERELGSSALGTDTGLVSPYSPGGIDYTAGRTEALYNPSGQYASLNETPNSGQYTSTHELQRLKDIELAKQARLKNLSLTL